MAGADEAIPITWQGNAIRSISAIPYSGSAAVFTNGYMSIFRNIPAVLHQEVDPVSSRHYEDVEAEPDFMISDNAGHPLQVNSTALAYSAHAQWLVTELPGHALVRINLADYTMLPFGSAFSPDGPSHPAAMAVTEDGRYVAVASQEYRMLKVFDLATCQPSVTSDTLAPESCQSYNYWPAIASHLPAFNHLSQLSFVGDGLLNFNAVTNNSVATSYVLSPTGSLQSLIPYIGLGDSYASGQGAFDYLAGTDTSTDKCHLSIYSYPLRLSSDLFGGNGHSVACSGARIIDIGNGSTAYRGQASDDKTVADRQSDGSLGSIMHNFLPGYLAQQAFVGSYQPGIITVQIGGNDAGFGTILERCVSPLASPTKLNPNNCYSSYEDRLELEREINRIYPRWVSLFQQLHGDSPLSRIYAIGYPQILSAKDKCGLNTPLTSKEVRFARELTSYLNGVIQKAAAAAGVQYIDISSALAGAELCSGNTKSAAVNGLTAGTDALGVLGQESFHPTAYGHELIEQAILDATHNFAATGNTNVTPHPAESLPTTNDSDPLLQVPPSGRPIYAVIYATNLLASHAAAGATVHLSLQSSDYNLAPNTPYAITLNDSQTLITATSNEQGAISTDVPIPADATVGDQTISVQGNNQEGSPTRITETIYITQDATDYDGDGTSNSQDSCPFIANSGIDADQDGIDDVCDPSLGTPASTTPDGKFGNPINELSGVPLANTPTRVTSQSRPSNLTSVAAAPSLKGSAVLGADTLQHQSPVGRKNQAPQKAVAKPLTTRWWSKLNWYWRAGLLMMLSVGLMLVVSRQAKRNRGT
jgi:lysophospholipase L1-like esterase